MPRYCAALTSIQSLRDALAREQDPEARDVMQDDLDKTLNKPPDRTSSETIR
jgi:hypothetical protein